jgi:hypothetical protein
MTFDLNSQKDRNEYAKSNEEIAIPKQFGYRSSANRYIKNYEARYGKQLFVVNQLDADCFEVINYKKNR